MRTFNFSDEQEKKLEAIKEQLESLGRWVEEYYRENDDNPVADYCTWGWKEGDVGELAERAKKFLTEENSYQALWAAAEFFGFGAYRRVSKTPDDRKPSRSDETELAEILIESAELQHIGDFYNRDGEIFSMGLGEIEERMDTDSELYAELEKLSPDEVEWLNRYADVAPFDHKGNLRDYFYVNLEYERWALILNPETLAENLATRLGVESFASVDGIATLCSKFFVTKTRDSGEEFVCCTDDAPEFLTDLVQNAHGRTPPCNFIYATVQAAVDFFADGGTEDEIIEVEASIYNSELLSWLQSFSSAVEACDEAAEEFGTDADAGMIDRIRNGQQFEIHRIYHEVFASIGEEIDELDY